MNRDNNKDATSSFSKFKISNSSPSMEDFYLPPEQDMQRLFISADGTLKRRVMSTGELENVSKNTFSNKAPPFNKAKLVMDKAREPSPSYRYKPVGSNIQLINQRSIDLGFPSLPSPIKDLDIPRVKTIKYKTITAQGKVLSTYKSNESENCCEGAMASKQKPLPIYTSRSNKVKDPVDRLMDGLGEGCLPREKPRPPRVPDPRSIEISAKIAEFKSNIRYRIPRKEPVIKPKKGVVHKKLSLILLSKPTISRSVPIGAKRPEIALRDAQCMVRRARDDKEEAIRSKNFAKLKSARLILGE